MKTCRNFASIGTAAASRSAAVDNRWSRYQPGVGSAGTDTGFRSRGDGTRMTIGSAGRIPGVILRFLRALGGCIRRWSTRSSMLGIFGNASRRVGVGIRGCMSLLVD